MGADYILVEDVLCLGRGCGQSKRMRCIDICRCSARAGESGLLQKMIVGCRDLAAALVPLLDETQFDAQHRALDSVHAGVPANLLVVVAAGRTVIPQPLHVLAHIKVHGGRGSGIAKCAEILGWVKAEGRGASQGSGMAPIPCGSKGLRGIFDDHELVGGGNCVKGVSIHTLAVEMHGHDAFEIGWPLIVNRVLDRKR